jgi:hypothetical protein
MQTVLTINSVSRTLPVMTLDRSTAAQLGKTLRQTAKYHAQVDLHLTVLSGHHVSLPRHVMRQTHTSVGTVSRTPRSLVQGPVQQVEAINAQMAKAALHTHSATKTAQMLLAHLRSTPFLLHPWIHTIVGIVLTMLPCHALNPAPVVRRRTVLEIFNVLRELRVKLRDLSSVEKAGMKPLPRAHCHVQVV